MPHKRARMSCMLESLKRVLRYLKATAHYSLILGRKGANNVDLVGWTDSDWAQDPDTRRSIGAFIFDVAGSKIAWSSKKQPTVALSTVESEYMAMSNATKEAIWLRTLTQPGQSLPCKTHRHQTPLHSRTHCKQLPREAFERFRDALGVGEH